MACLDGVAHHCGVCDRSVDDADELERELDALKAQLAIERMAHARTLAALHEAEEWMSSGDAIPVDGWGIRNKSADAERGAITERLRAAIAAAKVTP